MSKRKAIPSVDFDSWLTGDPPAPTQPDPPAVSREPSPPLEQPVVVVKEEKKKVIKDESEKVKASYHLDVATVQRIDEIQFRLKQLTRLRGHSVSKSRIIDAALRLAAHDLELNGLESDVALAILAESNKT